MPKTRRSLALVLVAVLVLVCAATAAGWVLLRDDDRSTRGTCGEAAYELSAEAENGDVEVSFELRSTAPGETWVVAIEQDGTELVTGERTTDEDAELDVTAYTGSEEAAAITATATDAAGSTCTATLQP